MTQKIRIGLVGYGNIGRGVELAINQFHVAHDQLIQPGDELAIFEPVTGG